MLERKDVRFKLAPDLHAALTVLADCAHVDIGEFVEMVVQREVMRRVHDSIIVAEAAKRAGIAGIAQEFQGTPGRGGV